MPSPLYMPAYGPWYCVTEIRGGSPIVRLLEGANGWRFKQATRKDGPFDAIETAVACGPLQCFELGCTIPTVWTVESTRRSYPVGILPEVWLHDRQEWGVKKFPLAYGDKLEYKPWDATAALPLWARYGIRGPKQEAMVL